MTHYNRIKFTEVWDKLSEPEFTTIRSWNPEKEKYYRLHLGEKFSVQYWERMFQSKNGRLICHAWLKGLVVVDPRMIPETLIKMDVTLDGQIREDWLVKVLKMPKVLLLTFDKNPIPYQKKLECLR